MLALAQPPLAVPAATKTIRLIDNRFSPNKASVARGTTVKFVWAGKNQHNVFAFSGPTTFHSRTQATGTYTRRLTRKGTYLLGCTIHGGMTITIRVR